MNANIAAAIILSRAGKRHPPVERRAAAPIRPHRPPGGENGGGAVRGHQDLLPARRRRRLPPLGLSRHRRARVRWRAGAKAAGRVEAMPQGIREEAPHQPGKVPLALQVGRGGRLSHVGCSCNCRRELAAAARRKRLAAARRWDCLYPSLIACFIVAAYIAFLCVWYLLVLPVGRDFELGR